jgi:hypothetical protein
MEPGLALIGVVILLLTWVDVVWTTLTLSGGGPLTCWIGHAIWKLLMKLCGGSRSRRWVAMGGWLSILAVYALWMLLLWVSWSIIFCSDPGNVVESNTGRPGDVWEKIYFTGFSIYTLGVGDFRPIGPLWQVLTPLASLNGFFFISLGITYFVPMISSAVQDSSLANYISSLGRTPEEILCNAWNGRDFGMLPQHLLALAPLVSKHGRQHAAYPMLFYVQSPRRKDSISINIAVLDETLSLIEHALAEKHALDASVVKPVRHSILTVYDSLHPAHVEPAATPPPAPSIDALRSCGVPTVSDEAFCNALAADSRRRATLRGLIENSGWSWKDVHTAAAA